MRPLRAAARLAAPPWGRVAAGAAVAAALAVSIGTAKRDDPSPVPAAGAAQVAPAAPATGPVKPRREVAMIGGKALQSARCVQWKRGTASQRQAIVSTLRAVIGGPTPYGQASALPPGEATALFDRACSHYYARGFLLYELYSRASAFGGAKPRY